MDDARNAISGVVELRTGRPEIAALATLAVDPMATLIGRFRERHPGVQVRMLEPESADGVRAQVHDGACELGAAHLPLPGDQLAAHPLGDQELLFVFPPQAALQSDRPLEARELARTPLVVSPPGTSTRILLEQALAAVGVTPQIAVQPPPERRSSRSSSPAPGRPSYPRRSPTERKDAVPTSAGPARRSPAQSASSTARRPCRQQPAHPGARHKRRPRRRLRAACSRPATESCGPVVTRRAESAAVVDPGPLAHSRPRHCLVGIGRAMVDLACRQQTARSVGADLAGLEGLP
jgi:hypothetical protein